MMFHEIEPMTEAWEHGAVRVYQVPSLVDVRTARLSVCERYRYSLEIDQPEDPRGVVLFVGLNPSVADHLRSDPTMTRCDRFARAWGFAGNAMGNLYAWRSTDPSALADNPDALGPDGRDTSTDALLKIACDPRVRRVVCAWGAHPAATAKHNGVRRCDEVLLRLLELAPSTTWDRQLGYLRLTRNGQPEHPLYMPSSQRFQPYTLETIAKTLGREHAT